MGSPYPYLLIDTDFVIIGANPSYLEATGRSAEDIVGVPIFEAFPSNPSDPDSTNLAEVRLSIEQAIDTRAPHTSAMLRYAIPRQTAHGTEFDDRYWSVIHTPIFNDSGAVAFVAQNAIDVTELYRFDETTKKYYLKPDANAISDIPQLNRPQMHEAMTRILTAERSQLQILFDQAPGFIAVLRGPEHTFDIVNDAFYRLFGYRDILGRPAMQALAELAEQGFAELLETAYKTGESLVLRERKISLRRQPGSSSEDRYVDLLYQPFKDAEGRVIGIFAQGNDVTEACQTKLALSRKIQQLEDARSNQAFQLEVADRIRQLSNPDDVIAAACEMLGRRLKAAAVFYSEGHDEHEPISIYCAWTPQAGAALACASMPIAQLGRRMMSALHAGKPIGIADVGRDELSAECVDAYEKLAVRAILLLPAVKGARLRGLLTVHNTAPRAWSGDDIALATEMAERTWSAVATVQAQAALRAERDQTQYIFDSMAEGFAVLDRHWTIMRMNAEGLRLSRRSRAQVIGKNHWSVFPEIVGTHAEAAYRRVMQTGKTETVERVYSEPDDAVAWMEIRAHRSLDGGIAFFFRDVSERRAAQEERKIADRRKDEFLAMLAHELRNPLAPIGSAAQLLQQANLDEARVRQTSQIIGRQVAHMTHLIDDLLDMSRVTRGLVTLDKAPHEMRSIVSEAIEQVTPLIESRRQHLTMSLPPDSALVNCDRKRLVQVIANIVNNAAKYTGEGGTIGVKSVVEEEQIVIGVTDNGIGMASDLVDHAFDLFAQAERTSDRSAGGLGLGLALVKNLVELHGGSVSCYSRGIGEGSTFTVRLPRIMLTPDFSPAPATPDGKCGAAPCLRILVVDDNVDAACMLAMLLEGLGHTVTVAHNAEEALAKAPAIGPQVCLLDIGLPGMDGNELARRLRRLPQTAQSLLVAVTGYGKESDRALTKASGFDHHFVKPLDGTELLSILAHCD